jgi:hypothetical protein
MGALSYSLADIVNYFGVDLVGCEGSWLGCCLVGNCAA